MIPYGHQSIDADDMAAVAAVLQSDFLTRGPAVDEFEAHICEVTQARHAVAFANGTAALHAAAFAAGLGPGDTVATSPLSFVASANCARYVGADVRFVDIDSATLNIDLEQIPSDIDALVAVHYAGLPVDLSSLRRRPRIIIEDAAHAIGASTPDGPVGNCAHSDLCCFSFHPVKTITTCEGGAVTTNSDIFAERLRTFRHHGIRATDASDWTYDIAELGYNYRLSDVHAALGTSQLTKLDSFLARRQQIDLIYRDELADLSAIQLPPQCITGWSHGYHLFAIRVKNRRHVYEELHLRGIGVQVHYVPIYRFSAYSYLQSGPEHFPATEAAYSELLSLPMFPGLTDDELESVVMAVRDIL